MSKIPFYKQFIFLLVAISVSITACKKDPLNRPQDPAQIKKITRVTTDAFNYSTFEYTDGNLSKMTVASNEGGVQDNTTIKYLYNAQKKPIELTIAGLINFKYIYTNNHITKIEMFSNNAIEAYDVIIYKNDRVSKIENYIKTAGIFELDSRSETSYYDNGNVKENSTYLVDAAGQLNLFSIKHYLQYDANINPFKSLGEANIGLFPDFFSVNNIAKFKQLKADGAAELETATTYTYDALGYPLTATAKTTENGTVTTKTSTFIYE